MTRKNVSQVLYLSRNNIMDIPVEAFRNLKKLRIVVMSHNKLRTLPDNLFADAQIELLDLSHNQFMRLPIKALSMTSISSLTTFDMSWNFLSGVHSTDAVYRLKVSSTHFSNTFISHISFLVSGLSLARFLLQSNGEVRRRSVL